MDLEWAICKEKHDRHQEEETQAPGCSKQSEKSVEDVPMQADTEARYCLKTTTNKLAPICQSVAICGRADTERKL